MEAQNQNQCRKMISGTITMRWLTQPELDAAHQLIQLSGDSVAAYSSSSGAKGNSLDYLMHNTNRHEAESVGDGDIINCGAEILSPSSSSSNIRMAESLDVCEEMDASSLRKRKFRSVADLYANTKPLVKELSCS